MVRVSKGSSVSDSDVPLKVRILPDPPGQIFVIDRGTHCIGGVRNPRMAGFRRHSRTMDGSVVPKPHNFPLKILNDM